jgi:predicted transcriptional regulator YheO
MLPSSSVQRTDEETTIELLCMNCHIKPLSHVTFYATPEEFKKKKKKENYNSKIHMQAAVFGHF